MGRALQVTALSLFSYALVAVSFAKGSSLESQKAFVYRGTGTCVDGCAEAAAEIPASLGMQIEYITPQRLRPDVVNTDSAAIWVQGGGNALKAVGALSKKQLQVIRDFVRDGGAYVGFCAGAFLADRFVDDDHKIEGLGLIPFSTEYYPLDVYPNGAVIKISWMTTERSVFFNGGATFNLRPTSNVEVIARYENGKAAAIQTKYGKGTVVLSGFHPEATWAWLRQSNLSDPDGLDHDLAQQMIERALKN